MGLLEVGTVSVDDTHIKANASKHKSLRCDRSGDLEQQLRQARAELEERARGSPAGASQPPPKGSQQAYNAQAVVDIGDSRLIPGKGVVRTD